MKHFSLLAFILLLPLIGCPQRRPTESWENYLTNNDWKGLNQAISNGLSIDASDVNGDTILVHALYTGRTEIADKLISKGACFSCKSSTGYKISDLDLHLHVPSSTKEWLVRKRKEMGKS